MLLFVFYAALVWYASFRGRRRVIGFAALAIGIFVLLVFNELHQVVAEAYDFDEYLVVFRVLLYPYIGIVALVGLFLVTLPIDLPRGELHCRACRYDLSDLKDEMALGLPCPECGMSAEDAATITSRRRARRRMRAEARRTPEIIPGLQVD